MSAPRCLIRAIRQYARFQHRPPPRELRTITPSAKMLPHRRRATPFD